MNPFEALRSLFGGRQNVQKNPLEAMMVGSPLFDPLVQQLAVQLGGILHSQIIPPDWDRAECLIGPVQAPQGAGLGYTVSRAGVPEPALNVNLPFHRLAQQLHHYWVERYQQPFPPIRIEVFSKPEGGWGLTFNIVEADSPSEALP
jgi:hypothetical protein